MGSPSVRNTGPMSKRAFSRCSPRKLRSRVPRRISEQAIQALTAVWHRTTVNGQHIPHKHPLVRGGKPEEQRLGAHRAPTNARSGAGVKRVGEQILLARFLGEDAAQTCRHVLNKAARAKENLLNGRLAGGGIAALSAGDHLAGAQRDRQNKTSAQWMSLQHAFER